MAGAVRSSRDIQVPTGTLSERLRSLADLHERNARLLTPSFTGNRALLETVNRHILIHEQAAADLSVAARLLAEIDDAE